MKNFFRTLNILLFIFIVEVCCGCSQETPTETPPVALAVIIGNHSNGRKCTVSLEDKIGETYSAFGNVSVIIADGNPMVVADENGDAIGFCDKQLIKEMKRVSKDNSEYLEDNYVVPLVTKVNKVIDENYADDPELDVIKALQTAVRQLNAMEISMGTKVKKEIIICDSGLSTTGELSFLDLDNNSLLCNNKLWEGETGISAVQSVVNQLQSRASIPDLSDITVTWYGLGAVGGEQDELNGVERQNLQYIWGEVLNASGATGSHVLGSDNKYAMFVDVNAGESIQCEQPVTKVIFWRNTGKDDEDSSSSAPLPIAPTDTFFEEDSAVFRKDINPKVLLKPWADNINHYPDLCFLLVGTTADPSRNGGDMKLSLDRANAVRDVLVNNLGVDTSRLKTVGMGAKAPWHNKNEWQDGEFISDGEAAKSNRAVRILPIDSQLAIKILDGEYN